ncbi:polyunsaturated fatty acid lipoxygenase ALOX15B-like isoform X2 [Camelus bactrianus]
MGEYWDVGPVLLLLRVHKTSLALPSPLGSLAPDAWFCHWLQLMPPRGSPLCFPCYQWLEGEGSLVLREGTAKVVWQDSHCLLYAQHQAEIKERQQKYRWSEFLLGIPHCLDAENLKELDPNLRYSITKEIN